MDAFESNAVVFYPLAMISSCHVLAGIGDRAPESPYWSVFPPLELLLLFVLFRYSRDILQRQQQRSVKVQTLFNILQ